MTFAFYRKNKKRRKKMDYSKKTVISGLHIEETEYTDNYFIELDRPRGKQICQWGIEPNPEEPIKEKQKDTKYINRTVKNISRVINSNITKYSKFITLTFAETTLDRAYALKCFNQFRKNFERLFGFKLKYLCNQERQHDRGKIEGNLGTWHFHIVNFTDTYLNMKKLIKCWSYGHVDIAVIDRYENLYRYFAKYLHKQLNEIKVNQKAITMSRGLKKPNILYDSKTEYPENTLTYEKKLSIYDCNDVFLRAVYTRDYDLSKRTKSCDVLYEFREIRIEDGISVYRLID